MNDIILNINTEVATNQRIVEIEQRLEVLEENKLNTDKQFNKQQIKEFTKEIRELNKEKKQLEKQDTEPKSVLDYVNKCFSKTKANDLNKAKDILAA